MKGYALFSLRNRNKSSAEDHVAPPNLQSRWTVKHRSRWNMDTAVWVVIPKCKFIPSVLTVAFWPIYSSWKMSLNITVDANVDGLTNERTENRIPISRDAKSRRDRTLRKHAYSNILRILPPKNENFQIKKIWYFSNFCSKHRFWVLVRTASTRRF